MTKKEIFAAWAPKGAAWTPWVKPVLFAHMDDAEVEDADLSSPRWISEVVDVADTSTHHRSSARSRDVAIVVDRPARISIRAGLALAETGFFPVPLFNALPHDLALIDMNGAIAALVGGAKRRAAVSLPADAPPVFLLDARRRSADPKLGERFFDNRSVMFETDFPSADRLRGAGIARIVLVQRGSDPAVDLVDMLVGWQNAGLEILLKRTDQEGPPAAITVRRRSLFARIGDGFARASLRRDPAGAFGALIERSPAGG